MEADPLSQLNSLTLAVLRAIFFKVGKSDIHFVEMKNTNIITSFNDNTKGSLMRDIVNMLYAPTVSDVRPSFFDGDRYHAFLNDFCCI